MNFTQAFKSSDNQVHPPPPLNLQRTTGNGTLRVAARDSISYLQDLYQSGAAKIRFPRAVQSEQFSAVLINTSGGMTGGDTMSWGIAAASNAQMSVSTQACEKIYRSLGGAAETHVKIDVGANARVDWLPQETILFDQSNYSRKLSVDISKGGEALIVEPVIFGRLASGETKPVISMRDHWRIRFDGKLIHSEALRIEGDTHSWITSRAGANGLSAFATILLISDDCGSSHQRFRQKIDKWNNPENGLWAAQSLWNAGNASKLALRMAAPTNYELRKGLTDFVAMLSQDRTVPKVWEV